MSEPVLVESGRYRVLADGAGSWWLLRATEICEKCQGCGCGSQQDPVEAPDLSMGLPAILSWMARNRDKGIMASMGGMLSGRGSGAGGGNGAAAAEGGRAARRRRNRDGAVGHADQEADSAGHPAGTGAAVAGAQ